MGPYQISQELEKDKIPCPAYHMQQMGLGLWKTREIKHPYRWSSSTIANMLTKKEYLGHTVNFKTRKHFKDKKSHYVITAIDNYESKGNTVACLSVERLQESSRKMISFTPDEINMIYQYGETGKPELLGMLNEILPVIKDTYNRSIVSQTIDKMGYCFIPTTKAQCMLMLIGNGGEGKSRIGLVMRNLLGDNMNVCSIAKLATNKYCPADQEGKLLMVDDDAKMEALAETNMLKAVITLEDKMDLEKKRVQSYQGYLYVRIMAFGNGSLTSLYDKSDGFYRRQIIIVVKDRNPGRIDDTSLSKKLKAESEGIALWCLEGLKKLVADDFHFTISDKAKLALEDTKREGDNILEFLDSEGYIHFQEDMEISAKDLYEIYTDWCMDNCEKARAQNSFSKAFKVYAEKRGLEYQKNLKLPNGKRCRGYRGLCGHPGENPFTRPA